MRVALVVLTAGGLSGGFRKYLRCLLPLLGNEPGVSDVRVFVPEPLLDALPVSPTLETWTAGDARSGFRRLKADLGRLRPDVVFVPTARVLGGLAVPQVVMVRNMEPFEQPFRGLSLRGALTNLGRLLAARRACARASRVIAVSRHVADTVARRFGVPATRIAVVYHGVDGSADDPATAPPAAAGQGRPFLFTAGSIRPARGLEDLLDAMARLAPDAPDLLVAGAADPDSLGHARRVAARSRRLGLETRWHWLGQLRDDEMHWCFRHALAFVTTSRAEACPNTALEALGHGCPVVSTDHPPMPEVIGEAARYYRAADGPGLAAQIRAACAAPPAEVDAARRVARERAGRFTWRATSQATADVLRAAAADARF